MKYECELERFLNDTMHHKMHIIQDDGIYRRLTFTNNGSSVYAYSIITWPGTLCIKGDCGTYVFSRVQDMFEFFWMKKRDFAQNDKVILNINPGYWGEKLDAIGTNAGYKEFSPVLFREAIMQQCDSYIEHWNEYNEEDPEVCNLRPRMHQNLEAIYDERDAYSFVNAFEDDETDFEIDTMEIGNTEEYTFHYIWCLYAIVHAIKMYRKEITNVND